jgi:hypothetical protein
MGQAAPAKIAVSSIPTASASSPRLLGQNVIHDAAPWWSILGLQPGRRLLSPAVDFWDDRKFLADTSIAE